ncbi:MAG: oxygen-independent coproporphyrinogen III oxidase [Cryobacterium sp.]|nr:oxygen-independent coproporphyrinogen III oxidase [Oligoflexia bacterium]
MSTVARDLVEKYDVPAPRYTSYPTVPYWESAGLTTEIWTEELKRAFSVPTARWSLYLHIPFCETLCTFCGCNTSITKNHNREDPYIAAVHREWELYLKAVPGIQDRVLEEIHLGGGTPTFLSPDNLKKLLAPILAAVKGPEGQVMERSIEVDPRRTNREHLKALREVGFTRVSMGVQDFTPEVQKLVNRIQPVEMTENLTREARELGFHSVNFDLIYGLPKQNPESMRLSMEQTLRLRPDRIALYSYAHVPWMKAVQRLFTESDLPAGADKRILYEIARTALLENGYAEIGMDHFALKTDSLFRASESSNLHRNFMGYTSRRTDILLGLGVSSISETPGCFHQNEKALPAYEKMMEAGKLTTHRGHLLTTEDRKNREEILELMTKLSVEILPDEVADAQDFLAEMIADGLVEIRGSEKSTRLSVTEKGRPFLRNACLFFDRRLRAKAPQTRIFSKSI